MYTVLFYAGTFYDPIVHVFGLTLIFVLHSYLDAHWNIFALVDDLLDCVYRVVYIHSHIEGHYI